jgi:hypothetical protein
LTNDSTISGDSLHSDTPVSAREILMVVLAAAALVALGAWWAYASGSILFSGDAQAHLSISRSLVDSRTHSFQIGNVWLPVLHLICAPFAENDFLWRSGLAGTIPVAACFLVAIIFFYAAAREIYGSVLPAAITIACFALNPNLLYLAATPMTEVVFFAGAAVQLWALLRFRRAQRLGYVLLAGAGSIWCSLTRYDGWFLIPFVALGFFLFARRSGWKPALLFAALASTAPLYWFAHNWWVAGDALSFYRGPYSAKAIYERGLRAGQRRDPGDHHLLVAIEYYLTAGRWVIGWPLLWIGAAGIIAAVRRRKYAAILFLVLTPCFYVLAMYSSGNPIHVPNLWPFSYYNTRYAIALLPLCAFGAGALVLALPKRAAYFVWVLPLLAVLPWIAHPSHERWICWKEAEHNSVSRRFWTAEVAQFFESNYRQGEGILYADGDVPAVFARANIPLGETISPGDGIVWMVNNYHPEVLRMCKWAVVLEMPARDPLAVPMNRARKEEKAYKPVLEVHTKYDPVVRVYRRR